MGRDFDRDWVAVLGWGQVAILDRRLDNSAAPRVIGMPWNH